MMSRLVLFFGLFTFFLSSQALAANSLDSLKQARLYMFRSSVDILAHRGEGLDETLELKARGNLRELQAALSSGSTASLTEALNQYSALVEESLNYDPQAVEYEWGFNQKLTDSLRNLDHQIRQLEELFPEHSSRNAEVMEQAVRLELLAVRYLLRAYDRAAYIRGDGDYFDQDSSVLAAELSKTITRSGDLVPEMKVVQRDWQFIEQRFLDNSLALTPFIVARNSRKISSILFAAVSPQ